MANEPQWQVWLEQLVRVHAALDKIGSAIYPADIVDDYIKAIWYEVMIIHSKLNSLEKSAELEEATNSAILKILKTRTQSFKDFANQDLFDEYDVLVRKHYKEIAKDPNYFTPNYTTWTSEMGQTSTTASIGIGYGKSSGIYIEWYEDGTVKSVGAFDGEEPTGVWAVFSRRGHLLSRYDHNAKKSDLVELYKKSTSIAEADTSKEEDDIGFGSVVLGSLAAVTISSIVGMFKKKTKKKEVFNIKHEESVEEHQKIEV